MKLFFWEKRSQNACVHCKYDFVLHDTALNLLCQKSQRLVVPASVSKTRKYMTFKFSPYRPEFVLFLSHVEFVMEKSTLSFFFWNVFSFILLLNVMYSTVPKMISLLTLNFDFCVHG
jgi:hypothetical protein